MKTHFTNNKIKLALGIAVLLIIPFWSNGQNLLNNPGFNSGSTYWNFNSMSVEINPETTYGGSVGSNKTAEIDNLVGLRQKVSITVGKLFQLSYKATRRISGSTPANPGITIKVYGDITNTIFLTASKTYNNSTFGYTTEVLTFAVPSNSTDNNVVVQFTGYNNASTFGVIVDDISLTVLSTLPVQLISFTGEIQDSKPVLNWNTAREMNNKHFIIERSFNGSQFDSIGIVRSAFTNNGVTHYTYTDGKMYSGTIYYRLRQVDIDDSYTYSKVVALKWQANTEGVRIFPTTPASTLNVSMTSNSSSETIVSVIDISGRIMIRLQKVISAGPNQQSIEVSSLGKGTYYLHIQSYDGSINFSQAFQKL